MSKLVAQLVDIWQSRGLLWVMVTREVSSRFTGTVAGPVWLYAPTILTVMTYVLVFDVILKSRLGDQAPTQSSGLYLVIGMVPWLGFVDAVGRTMTSIVEAGPLLQKNALAPALFPARTVLVSSIVYIPPLFIVAAYAVIKQGGTLSLAMWPIFIIFQIAMSFVLGYALAIFMCAMRDVAQAVGFILSLGLFASPVLFTPDIIPEAIRWMLWLNPMTPVINGFQSILLSGQIPPPSIWIIIFAWLGGGAILLNWLISRSTEHLVDWL